MPGVCRHPSAEMKAYSGHAHTREGDRDDSTMPRLGPLRGRRRLPHPSSGGTINSFEGYFAVAGVCRLSGMRRSTAGTRAVGTTWGICRAVVGAIAKTTHDATCDGNS